MDSVVQFIMFFPSRVVYENFATSDGSRSYMQKHKAKKKSKQIKWQGPKAPMPILL